MNERTGKRGAADERLRRREELLERMERITEVPMLILAACMIPLLLGPFLWELTDHQSDVFFILNTMIWAAFGLDLVVKTAVAPRRLAYLRAHWLDVAILIAPPFRPLRLARLVLYGSRILYGLRRISQVDYLLVYAVLLVMVSATVVTSVETGENAQITSLSDALWWATVTVTTIGYGDIVPVSETGRAMGYVLVLGGVLLFSALTANFAASLVRGQRRRGDGTEELISEVRALRAELAERRGSPPPPSR